MSADCIFCKIASGEIPAGKVYEDDEFVAFKDIHPAAPIHILLIPKAHIETLADCQTPEGMAMVGRMMALAPKIALDNGAPALPQGVSYAPAYFGRSASVARFCQRSVMICF